LVNQCEKLVLRLTPENNSQTIYNIISNISKIEGYIIALKYNEILDTIIECRNNAMNISTYWGIDNSETIKKVTHGISKINGYLIIKQNLN
jgi:hypothetical protein